MVIFTSYADRLESVTDGLFTREEVARILGVSPFTVRTMLYDGRLNSVKLNNRRYVTRQAIRDHLADLYDDPEMQEYVDGILRSGVGTKAAGTATG